MQTGSTWRARVWAQGARGRTGRAWASSLSLSASQTSSPLQGDSRGDRGTQFHRTCPAAPQHPLDAAGAGIPAPASRVPGIWSPSGRCSPSPSVPGLESPLPGGLSFRGSSPQPSPAAVFLTVGQEPATLGQGLPRGLLSVPADGGFGNGGAASFHIRSLCSRGPWGLDCGPRYSRCLPGVCGPCPRSPCSFSSNLGTIPLLAFVRSPRAPA